MVILSAIIAAILGAFSAFVFNLLHWKIVDKRNNTASLGRLVSTTIKDLETKSVEYWLAPAEMEDIKKKALEIEIKSFCVLNNRLLIEFTAKVADKAPTSSIHLLHNFKGEIFDLAAGGDFESVDKKSEPRIAGKVSKLCTRARSEVLKIIY